MRPSDFIADFFNATEGSIYLCSLPNERGAGQPAEVCGRGSGTRLDDLINQWDKKDRGTFFCINTLRPRQSRRSKETVHEITCLHADIDFGKIDLDRDAILARLNGLPCLPTKVVSSGHGFHTYWILREAVPATQENIAHVEGLLRSLSTAVGGDPAVAEVARLMRLPFSFNTKNGERLPVTVIVDRPLRYELSDLEEWLEAQRPIIPRKGAVQPDNPFLAIDVPGAGGAPVDTTARLAAMRFHGAGDTSVHQTQLTVSAAMLNRGHSIDDTVETILQATRTAAGAQGARWNWDREAHDIRAMCASWGKKKSKCEPPGDFVFDGAEPVSPPEMLADELLSKHGVAIVGGQSGAGKTFLVVLMAVCLASGKPFFGKAVREKVGVLYVAAEGQGMIAARVAAAKGALKLGLEQPLPIAWLKTPPPLNTKEHVEDFIGRLRALDLQFQRQFGVRLGAVVLDTVAATFDMKDENDNAEAARACARMRQIADGFGGVVVPVHHYGKSMESGLRGASAWRAGADIVLAVLAEVDPLTGDVERRELAITKSRDGVTGAVAPFTLEFTALGVTAHGSDFGTCYVAPNLEGESTFGRAKRQKAPRSEMALREAVAEALSSMGENRAIRTDGPTVRATKLKHVRDEFKRRYATGSDGGKAGHAKIEAFRRALQKLPKEFGMGEIEDEEWIWKA
jgi:hypothetical protein